MLFSNIIGSLSLPSASSIVLYINLGILALFLIAFLIGYARGLFKSVFNIAASCGMVLLFFLVFPLISKAIIGMDLTKFGLDLDIEGIKLVSIGQFLEDYLVQVLNVQLPNGVGITESFIYLTAYSVVELVLRIALLVVLFVLNLTVFKFIYWVVYMIVKPRPRDEYNRRIKQSKMSRVYGGLISILNFVLILFIFCVPLSAVFSLVEAAGELVDVTDDKQKLSEKVLVSFDGEKVELSTNNRELLEALGLEEEYIDILSEYSGIYRKTIPGFIYSIPISGRGLDTFVFDSLLTVEYNDKKIQVRKELQTVIEIIGEVTASVKLDSGISSMDDIMLIVDALTEEQINRIFDKLNELDVVEFAIPLVADTFEILVQYGDEKYTAYIDFVDAIKVVKNADYKNLISQLGKSIGSLKALFDEVDLSLADSDSEEFNFGKILTAKPATVQKVLDNIAGIELLDQAFKAVENNLDDFLLENETFNSFMLALPEVKIENGKYVINGTVSNVDVVTEELDTLEFALTDDKKWIIKYQEEEFITDIDATSSIHMISVNGISISKEIKNIGKIYEAFSALGISSIEQMQGMFDSSIEAEEINYDLWTKEKLDVLSQSIIDLQIVSRATGNLMIIVNNMLPVQYRNKIIIPDSLEANDLSCLLIILRTVIKEGLLNVEEGEEIDFAALIENNMDELVEAIKSSPIIMSNMTPMLNMLFDMVFEGEEIIVIADDVKWENEIEKLFAGVKEILVIDFTSEEIDLSNLNVENLSKALSESTVLTSNLNNILKWVLSQIEIEGFEINISDEYVWDYDQIYSMFSAVKIVLGIYDESVDENNELQTNILLDKLCNLPDEDIDVILGNDLICEVLAGLLYDQANSDDGSLKGVLVVNISKDDKETWIGTETNEGELSKILRSARLLINGVDFDDEENMINNILDNLTTLDDPATPVDEVEKVSSSIVLSDTIVMHIENMNTEDEEVLVIPEDVEWKNSGSQKGELYYIIKALGCVLSKVDIDFNNFESDKLLDAVLEFNENEVNTLFDSRVLESTVDKYLVDYAEEGLIVYKDINDLGAEFNSLLVSVKLVFGDDFKFVDLEDVNTNEILYNISHLSNNINTSDDQVGTLLESKILSDTIVKYVTDYSLVENSPIVMPQENLQWYDTEESGVKKPGELRAIIGALGILFADEDEIDLNAIDANIIKGLSDSDVDTILISKILSLTVKSVLESLNGSLVVNEITDLNNELKSLVYAVDVVFDEDEDLNNPEFDVNIILTITDEELDRILDSKIIFDTFYHELHILTDGDLQGILVFKPGMEENEEELIKFVNSIKVVLGHEGSLTDMEASHFDINTFINLTDDEIDKLIESTLVSYSAALQIEPILYGSEAPLNDYVETSDVLEERIEIIEEDLANLIRVLRDLDAMGISYNEFSFEAFDAAINSGEDADANAEEIADILVQSNILTKSLNKMMNKILSDALNSEEMENVNTDLTEEQWKGNENTEGELSRLLKLLVNLEQFTGEGASNSNIDNPEVLANPLKEINHSLVLHGLLPTFVSTATENLDSWTSGQEPETVDEWDREIDALSELVAKVSSIDLNLSDLEITGNGAVSPQDLGYILVRINRSIMLDINNIVEPLEMGVGSTFSVEIEISTDELVSEEDWNIEIEKIVTAITALQIINDIDIASDEVVEEKYGSVDKGYQNATEVGMFLDAAADSILLSQVIDSIIDSIIPLSIDFDNYFSGSYTTALQNIANLLDIFD